MAERLAIVKENGENLSVEFVSYFSVPEIQKQFLITSMNEIDPNGLVVLNVSEIVSNKLNKVESDEDWNRIKQIMRSIISSSLGDFKYMPYFTEINAGTDYARNISVQSVAKDQLVKDYYEKMPATGGVEIPAKPDDPIEDVPMNPALGNVPAPIGANEVAPGIVEVSEQLGAPASAGSGADNQVQVADANVPPVEGSVAVPSAVVEQQPVATNTPVGGEVAVSHQAPASVPVPQVGGLNFEQIVAEAKAVFLESSRNLAEVIVANAFEMINRKEEELRQREIIVSQREAAVNQQTMMSINQSYDGMNQQSSMSVGNMGMQVPPPPMPMQPQMSMPGMPQTAMPVQQMGVNPGMGQMGYGQVGVPQGMMGSYNQQQ